MAGLYFGNAAGTVAELSRDYFAELDALKDEGAVPPGVDNKTAYAAIDHAVRRVGARPKRQKRQVMSCLRRDCDGSCGLSHKRTKIAVERPDPTGLQAANVRTTGRATAKSAHFVRGGLPGLGKRGL